jgi:hypothetical protein
MRLIKNSPKRNQTYFMFNQCTVAKIGPKSWATSAIFKILTKSFPTLNWRKFAQSGRPDF